MEKYATFILKKKINNKIDLNDENKKSLQINENSYIIDEQSDITDPIMKVINKFKHRPSILLINSKLSSHKLFLSIK